MMIIRKKNYYVLLLLCILGFVGCMRDEFTGKESGSQEEILLQKAKVWYQENMDFVKNNPSTGIDVTHLTLNWDHKDFMKNQSGNTIISIPIEGNIRGYKTGALNVLLTKEGVALGVFKLYEESPGSTDMAYYSGTGQLIAKGFYNAEKGTFLPEELGDGISFKGRGYTEIEEVVIVVTNPIGGGTIGIGNSGPGTGGINNNNPQGSGFPPYGPGGPRETGGDNGTIPPQNQNQDIINNLQGYPCAQSIAQQLPTLKNDLAVSMRLIFQNNKNYNIIFKAKSDLGNVDGQTFTASNSEFNSFKAIINLNDQVLLHSTKEYILVTMYHEVIHAFLDYERFRLGNTAFQDQYPGVIVGYDYASNGTVINRYTFVEGHQQLIPFLTTLQNIISTYNPNIPHDVVVAMARTGITTTKPEQIELNKNEKNTLLGKQKGTKCP